MIDLAMVLFRGKMFGESLKATPPTLKDIDSKVICYLAGHFHYFCVSAGITPPVGL